MMVVGQSMIRVDDGMRGTVVITEGDTLRITYLEMGETRYAGKGEKWELVRAPPRKMRDEEMFRVARWSDIALRAVEMNEPVKWWVLDSEPPYDQGLIDAIVAYLKERA